MRVVIAYESMFGNTRLIAEAIAKGIDFASDVRVVSVNDADGDMVGNADLLIVGGPTHAHGMSRPTTRKSAADIAAKPKSTVVLEPYAQGKGVREWLDAVGPIKARAAAFDTRMKGPRFLTGSAAKGIARRLERTGALVIEEPVSFFVTKDNTLRDGEEEQATEWGQELAETLAVGTGHRSLR